MARVQPIEDLQIIEGSRLLFGYPHLNGVPPEAEWITPFSRARNFWNSPHPDIEELCLHYDETMRRADVVQRQLDELTSAADSAQRQDIDEELSSIRSRVARLQPLVASWRSAQRNSIATIYNRTAQRLGFTQSSDEDPWHTFKAAPADFGAALFTGDHVATDKFFRSVETFQEGAAHLTCQKPMHPHTIYKFNWWSTDAGRILLPRAANPFITKWR